MSTEERRVQLVAEVDTTRTRTGFQEIGQQAGQMAQQVTQAGERAERAVAGVGTGAAASSQRVDSASRSIIGSIQRTTAAMEAGGRQTVAYYEAMARQRGIDPNTLRPYLDQLRSVEQAQARTAASAGTSAAQIANAMRMVPAQLTDVATQLAGGQSPFLVLLQQGGQLRDQFGSIPATIRGVGSSLLGLVSPAAVAAAGIGALVYAYSEGSKEADAFNRAIVMSGNAAGTSRNQLADYAREISKTVGTQADAAAALAALASTGQVGSENLKQFGAVAVQIQREIGRNIEETAKDFAELGKSPVEASLKLSESYHYLTGSVYEQIKALQEQGKTEEAAEVAQKAYAATFADRAAKMKENLGTIESGWRSVKDVAAAAWDAFLGVGRKKTPQQELVEINAAIARAEKPFDPAVGGNADDRANLQKNKARKVELEFQINKEAWDNQQAAISEKLRQATLEWDKVMEGSMSKAERLKLALKKVQEQGEAAGASDDAIKKAKNKVLQEYASLDNPALAALEGESRRQKEILAGQLNDLESNYKQRILSESQYIEQKRDLQLQENKLEIDLATKRAQIDQGKEDQSAYKKDLADLAVLVQQRLNIANGATNALANADAARKKSMDELVLGWDRTIGAEKDAVAQELVLFGQSDQARRVYLEQAKIDLEVRKLITDQIKEGHALTQQEIADLYAKANAKKADKANVLNEAAALSAASQLLRENERFSAEYIADTELRAQRITAIDARQWQYLIDHTAEGSEARKKILEQFDVWMANRQMQPVLDRWKGVIDNLDNNFQEGFRDMLTNGQNAWSSFAKSIGNTLKTSLADALYQTFIKKYVVQIVAGFAGVISGPAVASALTGTPGGGVASTNGAIGSAQSASNLYSMFKSGGTMEQSIANGVQTGFDKLGLSMGSGAPGTAAQWLGAAGGIAAGYGIGSTLNSTISGKYETGSGVMTVEKIGTAIASVFAGPFGGAVAGVIGGFINRAFGMGPTEVRSQGLRGTLSASSLTGENYAMLHQDGGWFRGNKDWPEVKQFTDAMTKQFTQGLSAIESASIGFASALGVQADWIGSYSKTFDIAQTGDATKDAQAITDFFTGIGDEIAKKLVPNLDDLSKSGETASAALERLANDFKGTDQVAQLLGFSANSLFGSAGLESAKAREQLIDLAGGLSALSSQAAFFNQNFLSDAERIKPVAEALDKALASLGLSSIPKTRDEFKALVDDLITSGAAATNTGAKQLDSLLALGEAFAQVHPEIQSTADALQAMKDAASGLLGNVDSSYSVLEKVVGREKAAVQTSIDAHTEAFSKLQSLSQALHSTLDSLQSPEQKLFARSMAQAEVRADLAITKAGGTLSDEQIESLKKALGAVTQDASGQFSSYPDYLRDLYQTQNDIAQLGDVTDSQLSVEQKALDAAKEQLKSLDGILSNAQDQIDVLKGIDTNGLTLVEAMQALTSAIVNAKSNPIVGATSAINGAYQQYLGRAPDAQGLEWWQNAAANGAPVDQIVNGIAGSTEASLVKMYKDVLGRAPDAEGLQFWMKAYGSQMDAAEQADWMKAAQEELSKKLRPFAVGTNKVPYDMPALIHKDERIIPAADNRMLMARLANPSDNSAVLASTVKSLQDTIAKQQGVMEEMAADMAIMAETLKNVAPGGFIRVKGV